MAKVAVITRTKDREVLLERAIKSVLDQTFSDWVHVIVNDGGEIENIKRLAETYETAYAGRLQLIDNKDLKGMEHASNLGISQSKSKYIVIHDDDDSWQVDFLEKCIDMLEGKGSKDYNLGKKDLESFQGVVTQSVLVKEELIIQSGAVNENTAKILERHPFNSDLKQISLYEICKENKYPPISFVFSREAYDELGGFNEDLPVRGDWDFNLRFLEKYNLYVIPELLANYHHRVNAQGSFKNTVGEKEALHEFYENKIRQDYLRSDLKHGKFGLGVLLNIGKEHRDLGVRINKINAGLRKIKNNKIAKLLKKLKIY